MSEPPIEILTFFTHEFVLWCEATGEVMLWHEAYQLVKDNTGQMEPTPVPGMVYDINGDEFQCVHIDALDWSHE